MPDDNGAVHDPDAVYITRQNTPLPARDAHGHWLPGRSANPAGRPVGSPNKPKHLNPVECLQAMGLDPVADRAMLVQQLKAELQRNEFATPKERQECQRMLGDNLDGLMAYTCVKLKAVEHIGQLEIVQRLQNLEQYSDEELRQLYLEAEQHIKQLSG